MSKKSKKQVRKITKVSNVKQAKQTITQKFEDINRVVTRLESELEVLFKKIVKKGERSSKELRRSFDDMLAWVKSGELISLAAEKRDEVEREVKRLAEEVVASVKEIELIPGKVNVKGLFRDVRKNVEGIVEQLGESDLIQRAKQGLGQTKKEILGILSIPTQDEVVKLERKIVSLEKRLSNLTRKAA
ncbi:MAG: hypothetical protein U1F66_06695 [bacterium]